jgi:hypothetical protein
VRPIALHPTDPALLGGLWSVGGANIAAQGHAEVTHRTIRCLVSKPTNWECPRNDDLICDLAECVTRGMLLFEAIGRGYANVLIEVVGTD